MRSKTIIILGLILILTAGYFLYQNKKAPTTNPGIIPYKSGIKGVVKIGPTCPVERIPPDPNCADRPYQATLIIKNGSGHVVINSETKSDGTFKFSLPPGTYAIENGGRAVMPTLKPVSVEVGPNSYTEINLSFDSGIR